MDLISLINSRLGPSLGIALARLLSDETASRFANRLALYIARQSSSPLVQAVRANQAVVRGLPYDHPSIDGAVEAVMLNSAQSYVSLFKAMDKGHGFLKEISVLDETLSGPVLECLDRGRGVFFTGAHLLGFDHFLLMLGGLGYPLQSLSFPDPKGSYRVQNAIRLKFGINLTPISLPALRQAIRHLRGGGIVLTAVDRPDPNGEELEFFGKKAHLPTGYTRLILRSGAKVVVGGSYLDEDGVYRAVAVKAIDPVSTGDEHGDSIRLAQEVIGCLEVLIRRRPEQWLMFYPVWPETLPL